MEETNPERSITSRDREKYLAGSEFEDEVSLLDYWRVLYRWKWLIILLGLVATGISALVTLQMPKIYRATTTILPLGAEGAGGLAAAFSAVPFAGALGVSGIKTPADQLLIILGSRTLAETIIHQLNLQVHYHPNKWDPDEMEWKPDKEKPFLEDTVRIFKGNITVKGEKNGAVSLVVLDQSPALAADIANSMVSALAEFLNSHSMNINFQTIDPAVSPERKFKPSLRTNVLIAGVLALFVGIFLAFFLEYIKRIRENEAQVKSKG